MTILRHTGPKMILLVFARVWSFLSIHTSLCDWLDCLLLIAELACPHGNSSASRRRASISACRPAESLGCDRRRQQGWWLSWHETGEYLEKRILICVYIIQNIQNNEGTKQLIFWICKQTNDCLGLIKLLSPVYSVPRVTAWGPWNSSRQFIRCSGIQQMANKMRTRAREQASLFSLSREAWAWG